MCFSSSRRSPAQAGAESFLYNLVLEGKGLYPASPTSLLFSTMRVFPSFPLFLPANNPGRDRVRRAGPGVPARAGGGGSCAPTHAPTAPGTASARLPAPPSHTLCPVSCLAYAHRYSSLSSKTPSFLQVQSTRHLTWEALPDSVCTPTPSMEKCGFVSCLPLTQPTPGSQHPSQDLVQRLLWVNR